MSKHGERIIKSLKQALAYEQGDKTQGYSVTYYSFTPEEIAKIRKKYNLTQKSLSEVLAVSTRTVEAWETGINIPSGPANKLLHLLEADNENKIIEMLSTAQ